MGVISATYLKQHCKVIEENTYQVLLLNEDINGYYLVTKQGKRYTMPQRIKLSEIEKYKLMVRTNK